MCWRAPTLVLRAEGGRQDAPHHLEAFRISYIWAPYSRLLLLLCSTLDRSSSSQDFHEDVQSSHQAMNSSDLLVHRSDARPAGGRFATSGLVGKRAVTVAPRREAEGGSGAESWSGMKTQFVCGFASEIIPNDSTMPAAADWLGLHSLDYAFHLRGSYRRASFRRNDDHHHGVVSSRLGSVDFGSIPTNPAASSENHVHSCAGMIDKILDKVGVRPTDSDLRWGPTKSIRLVQQHNDGRFLHEFNDIAKSMERVALVTTVLAKSGRRRTTCSSEGNQSPGKVCQLFNT